MYAIVILPTEIILVKIIITLYTYRFRNFINFIISYIRYSDSKIVINNSSQIIIKR